jgi:baculoviral IAP repeat-containing protein 6
LGGFLFDIYLNDYPKAAPKLQYLTTGNGTVRFNPNLYDCGKVCLSLLGTWSGPGWQANKSTLLQVLISIQGLILVPDPYFNEPGYETSTKSPFHMKESAKYTETIRGYTMRWGIENHLDQLLGGQPDYPEFESVMTNHFVQRASAIREQMDAWVKNDAKLKPLAGRINTKLNQLVESEGNKKPAAARQKAVTIL